MIVGGAFDPPHLGHTQLAQAVLRSGLADRLIFMPAQSHPFAKNMAPGKDRLEMLNLLGVETSDWELRQGGKSYSLNTLNYWQKQHSLDQITFLIGSDNLPSFNKWYQYQELLENYQVFVYPRAGFPFTPVYDNMICLRNFPEIKISSTQVRETLKNKKSVNKLLDKSTINYIKEHKLYAGARD